VARGTDSRARLLDAAFASVVRNGYARTSARTIASIGRFSPGLIFYHYGTVDDLLVATLERSSQSRLNRYKVMVEHADSPAALLRILERLYREDVESGHVRVVSELVAASVAHAGLAAKVTPLIEPWVALAERAITAALADSPFAGMVPPRRLALAAATFYLGANLLTQLQPDGADVEELLGAVREVPPLLELLKRPASRPSGR